MKKIFGLMIFLIFLTSCVTKNYSDEKVSFPSLKHDVKLSGTLTIPLGNEPVPAVILVHGSGGHARDQHVLGHDTFKDLAHYLSSRGIAVLRYDKRGCGQSGGNFIPFDLQAFSEDGQGAIDFLKDHKSIDPTRIGIIGHSQGGLVAPMIALSKPETAFIVLLAAPGDWGYDFFYESHKAMALAGGMSSESIADMQKLYERFWKLLIKKDLSDNEKEEGVRLLRQLWGYLDMESRRDFGFVDDNAAMFFHQIYRSDIQLDLYGYDPGLILSKLTCPVLAINGDKDVQVVSELNLGRIEKALQQRQAGDYKIIELPGHNHLFQECETGRIAEYKKLKGSYSEKSLSVILDWIINKQ